MEKTGLGGGERGMQQRHARAPMREHLAFYNTMRSAKIGETKLFYRMGVYYTCNRRPILLHIVWYALADLAPPLPPTHHSAPLFPFFALAATLHVVPFIHSYTSNHTVCVYVQRKSFLPLCPNVTTGIAINIHLLCFFALTQRGGHQHW